MKGVTAHLQFIFIYFQNKLYLSKISVILACMGETTTTKGKNMKKVTIAEYLRCFDNEELIDMISETGSWDDIFNNMRTSCHEDLHNSVFDSSLEEMKDYITNELTYFINDDNDSIGEWRYALNMFVGDVPLWLQVELKSYIKTSEEGLRSAIDEIDRRIGFDI